MRGLFGACGGTLSLALPQRGRGSEEAKPLNLLVLWGEGNYEGKE